MLLVCIMIFATCVSTAWATDDSRTYDFDLTCSGSHTAAAQVGDEITVDFTLKSDAAYALYAMQNEILYDSNYLDLVEGSIAMNGPFQSGTRDMEEGSGKKVLMNFVTMESNGVEQPATVAVGSFRLKVIAAGSTTVQNVDCYCTNRTGSDRYAVATHDLTLTISGGSGPQTYNFSAPNSVRVRSGVSNGKVTKGTAVTFTLDADTADLYDAGKVTVTYRVAGGQETSLTANANGVFTIPGSAVTGDITVKVTVNDDSGNGNGSGSGNGNGNGNGSDNGNGAPAAFKDVPQSHWAYSYVEDMYAQGLIKGRQAGTELLFCPNDPITRAEFVTILFRMSGENVPAGESASARFGDVADDAYYAQAVAWATNAGVTKGTSDTTFSPNRYIYRQEIAAMICRYAAYRGIQLPKKVAAKTFTDADSIHAYARDAVSSMQQAGVIDGYGDGSFRPLGNTTRAETAKMLSLVRALQ